MAVEQQISPDGSYQETIRHGGLVTPVALPRVTIDLGTLLDT